MSATNKRQISINSEGNDYILVKRQKLNVLCDEKFNTQFAYIDGVQISIDQYVAAKNENTNETKELKCHNDHELSFANHTTKPYFRHKYKDQISSTPMTPWHKEWQSHFKNVEKIINGKRRCDAFVEEHNLPIEFQHSRITKKEVEERKRDYAEAKCKDIIWVIDGDDSILETKLENGNIWLEFESKQWIYDSFESYDFIFIDINNKIYKVYPKQVHYSTIVVENSCEKAKFIHNLKTNSPDLYVVQKIPQCKLTVVQQGAGNGKTYNIIQKIIKHEWKDYNNFVIVSLQHSAKHIIFTEFKQQHKDGKLNPLTEIDFNQNNRKQYTISYMNSAQTQCNIVIGTMDSWTYQLGNKNHGQLDLFRGIVQSIIEGFIRSNNNISYGGKTFKLDKTAFFICDETQDLPEEYGKAIIKLMQTYCFDAYIVADKLQSIRYQKNAFTYLFDNTKFPYIYKDPIQSINKCRRFNNINLINFVNHMIPFEKYKLPEISAAIEDQEKLGIEDVLDIFEGKFIHPNEEETKETLVTEVQKIMDKYKTEVYKNERQPNDFLIVTPFTNKNPLCNALEQAINDFWIDYTGLKNLRPYAVFHKSEEGHSVCLAESDDKTRIVSIHTAKGDGRNVVFVIGLDESSLLKFGCITGDLVYDSLLHVAITRMKKKLYIRYIANNDDIHQKLKKFQGISINNFETNTKTLTISKIINYTSIIDSLKQSHTFAFEKMQEVIVAAVVPNNSMDIKESEQRQLLEWSHHTIRYASMLIYLYITIVNHQKLNSSLRKQLNKLLKNIKSDDIQINSCDWKDYNNLLKENYLLKINFNEPKYQNKKPHLLLLKFSKPHQYYDQYHDIVLKFMEEIKKTVHLGLRNEATFRQLCPFETIVLYYMMETQSQGTQTNITIPELYNITHNYFESFSSEFEGHDKCLCKKIFKCQKQALEQRENNDTLKNMQMYLTKQHYEKISNLEKLYKKFLDFFPNVNWVINKNLQFGGNNDHFYVSKRFQMIGYDNSTTFIVYVKPDVNDMNIDQIKIDSIFDTLLIKRLKPPPLVQDKHDEIQKENFENYGKPIIKTIVFSLSRNDYITFEWNITETHEKYLIKQLFDEIVRNYQGEMGQIFNFYKHYRDENSSLSDKKTIELIIAKYEELSKYNKYVFPTFIRRFLESMQDDIGARICPLKSFDNKEYFEKKIQARRRQEIEQFLGHDDEEFLGHYDEEED